jgi:aminoglycoside phosphotransferase (APT) family kinase protein
MPDTRALFGDWVRERAADRGPSYEGRRSVTTVAEEQWVDRVARFHAVAPRLLAETRLLPVLAPLLPLAVPLPIVLDEEPLRVRHCRLPGSLANDDGLEADDGRRLGAFLRALHDVPESAYAGAGVVDRTGARAALLVELERMFHLVVPRLPDDLHGLAEDLISRVALPAPAALVHGDLAARHLTTTDGRVSGVLDWTHVQVADPARDLAWLLYGTPEPVAESAATTYGVTNDELRRALDWHRLAPWYDVLWELARGTETGVTEALDEVARRIAS